MEDWTAQLITALGSLLSVALTAAAGMAAAWLRKKYQIEAENHLRDAAHDAAQAAEEWARQQFIVGFTTSGDDKLTKALAVLEARKLRLPKGVQAYDLINTQVDGVRGRRTTPMPRPVRKPPPLPQH